MAYSFIPLQSTDTQAATAMSAALAANAAAFNYCSGFTITGLGATAASGITATLTGVAGGPLKFIVPVPAGVTAGLIPIVVAFDPPLQGSAINTAMTLGVPSFGSGNTLAACTIQGYQAV